MSRDSGADERGLRADAERNRERVIEAAREVFAEQGLDASLNEVARRAGVGVATLFRRFPNREALISATFAAKIAAYADATEEALADPDPWRGFCTYVERTCAMQVEDRGFTEMLTHTFPVTEQFEDERVRITAGFAELLRPGEGERTAAPGLRARRHGARPDGHRGRVAVTAEAAPGAWRRLIGYLLQSFAADEAPALPAPPRPEQILDALLRLDQSDD